MSQARLPRVAPQSGGPTDPSHDERLRRGIIDTAISRTAAWAITATFVAIIVAVPIVQAVQEKLKDEESSLLGLFQHVPDKERLRQFETELEAASYAKELAQQHVQLALSHYGRVGNKNAVIGHGGWLYYKPGITYLSGPPFLSSDIIDGRQRAALDSGDVAIQADPTPAILAFADMLSARGIKLVLFPVPDKAMLQPRELHGRGPADAPVPVPQSASFQPLVERLRARGVVVFEPAPPSLLPGEPARFLVQDTHWTPAWMEEVADRLAKVVGGLAPATSASTAALHAVAMPVERVGDIVDMLKLPEDQQVFRPSVVTVHQVRDESDTPWEPDHAGDVLLLGDSFTNVFTAEPMGWGGSAGFGAHLALSLGRSVDVIAQNDSGAYATRQALARELAAGEDRLAGKRVVIWEFASRELAVGDWKLIDWKTTPATAQMRKTAE